MLTFEDMTELFLREARKIDLAVHPEYWLNTRSLEREFACTCHAGTCEEAEHQSSCTVAFTWGTLDTALSLEGPSGVCEFFHEPEEECSHLHTHAVPPLVLDLSYSLSLNGMMVSEDALSVLTQSLRLRASEHSRRTIETRPGVSMVLHENRLKPEMLTLQQRVEIPLWHPLGMRGLHDDSYRQSRRSRERLLADDAGDPQVDEPQPEEWLPQVMEEVCQDILHVLAALDATLSFHSSDRQGQL